MRVSVCLGLLCVFGFEFVFRHMCGLWVCVCVCLGMNLCVSLDIFGAGHLCNQERAWMFLVWVQNACMHVWVCCA